MPSSYVIGAHFERFIKRQVESGRYGSSSEVIRDALRLIEEREKIREAHIMNLRERLQEGIESGAGIPSEEVFARLEKKYRH